MFACMFGFLKNAFLITNWGQIWPNSINLRTNSNFKTKFDLELEIRIISIQIQNSSELSRVTEMLLWSSYML